MNMFKPAIVLPLSMILASCGGNFGTTAATTTDSFTSAAQVGEVVTFNITKDSSGTPTAYSYEITSSAFGCEVTTASCHTGSGTLSKQSDGTFTMSQFQESRLRVLDNGLAFGTIQVPIGGVDTVVPFVGMKNPATSISDFADTNGTFYNWVQLVCTTPGGTSGGTCRTHMGSAKILANGTWSSCSGYNLADTTGGAYSGNNCVSGNGGNVNNGRFVNLNNGTWRIDATNDGSTYFPVGTFIAFKDVSSGQRVAIFDINDPTYGWGYGNIVASTQTALTTTSYKNTTWFGNQYRPTANTKQLLERVSLTESSTAPTSELNFTVRVTNVSANAAIDQNGTLSVNSVDLDGRGQGRWDGFFTPSTATTEVEMLAGTGFFAGVAGINGVNNEEPMITTGWKN